MTLGDFLIGLAFFLFFAAIFAGAGWMMWTETEGYREHIHHKKARNQLALEHLRRSMETSLIMQEWQATATKEDLEKHRERLNKKLDVYHDESE